MKTLIITAVVASLSSTAVFAQREPRPQPTLVTNSALSPARLQPATGIDLADGLGGRGTIRTSADSGEAWRLRFPKQPNGRNRQ